MKRKNGVRVRCQSKTLCGLLWHLTLTPFFLVMLYACGGGGGSDVPSTIQPVTPTGNNGITTTPESGVTTHFTNVTRNSGLDYDTGFVNRPKDASVRLIATSAAAAGDYDGDGDTDVFITRGDIDTNLLFRNDGNLIFTEVAEAAGLDFTLLRQSGATFADMDGDGDLDLFIGGLEDESLLYANNGDGTFTDVTFGSGIDTLTTTYNLSAAFGDYDLDGDLDLFVAHWGTPHNQTDPGDTQHLWRNDSDEQGIRFTSVSVDAAISPSIVTLEDPYARFLREEDRTFTPVFARIDADEYPDLLIAADFNQSQYFSNNGDGTFNNVTDVDVLVDGNGMGSAVGDYDNDGDLDWFVTSIMYPGDETVVDSPLSHIGNRLYENHLGVFKDVTEFAGVKDGGWGWGACFMDFENDGDLDIYHTNGWQETFIADDAPEPGEDSVSFEIDNSRAFVNLGDGSFTESAESLGLLEEEMGRGVVCADFDEDGDVDILLLHDKATLWRNDLEGNTYLRIKLQGKAPNTEASGARITVTADGKSQIREIMIGSNFLSQNPTIQVIGLGTATSADVTVLWPDGQETLMPDVPHQQTITVKHPGIKWGRSKVPEEKWGRSKVPE